MRSRDWYLHYIQYTQTHARDYESIYAQWETVADSKRIVFVQKLYELVRLLAGIV